MVAGLERSNLYFASSQKKSLKVLILPFSSRNCIARGLVFSPGWLMLGVM